MRNPSSSSFLMPTNHKKKSSNGSGSCSNTTTPCCNKVGLKRGPWTPEEDKVLADFIRKEGEGRWRTLPNRAGLLRCGKSCRLRWMNYLRPSVKRGQIAPDEEDLVLRLHRLLGNRWSLIAGRIPGRTDNEIKNYWNTHLSKKLIRQGIDPRTHKPLNPPQPPPITITNHQTPSDPHHNPQRLINIVINQDFDPNSTTHDHLDQHQAANNNAYDDNLNPAAAASATDDVSAIGAIRSKERLLTADNEDEDDVVFSSFLNSLINKDAFEAEHHLHSEHNIALPCDDPPAYGLGVAWDSPLVSATFSQNDPNPKRVDYQNE